MTSKTEAFCLIKTGKSKSLMVSYSLVFGDGISMVRKNVIAKTNPLYHHSTILSNGQFLTMPERSLAFSTYFFHSMR